MKRSKAILFRVAIAAVLGALLAFVARPQRASAQPAVVVSHEELRDDLRRLWTEHAMWTRVHLVGSLAGLADTGHSRARLLANNADLGSAVGRFHGGEAGALLTSLLDDQLAAQEEVVAAAGSGSRRRTIAANQAWYESGERVADSLAAMNPNLGAAEIAAMTHDQLDLVLASLDARLRADWVADIAAYDAVVDRSLVLADAITDAIAAEFPDAVSPPSASLAEENLRLTMRELWEDHVMWTRMLVIAQVSRLPDAAETAVRLLRNQREIGSALKPFYGDVAGAKVGDLLEKHVLLGAAVVDAASTHDQDRLRTARTMWYANAYTIDIVLAIALPSWTPEEIRDVTKIHLDETSVEAMARVLGSWEEDVDAYDVVEANALRLADMMSEGIGTEFLVMR